MTRQGVDPLFGKELMGIKSDRVFQRYTKGVFKQAAAEAYLKAIAELEQQLSMLQALIDRQAAVSIAAPDEEESKG